MSPATAKMQAAFVAAILLFASAQAIGPVPVKMGMLIEPDFESLDPSISMVTPSREPRPTMEVDVVDPSPSMDIGESPTMDPEDLRPSPSMDDMRDDIEASPAVVIPAGNRACRCLELGAECFSTLDIATGGVCKLLTPTADQSPACKKLCCDFCTDVSGVAGECASVPIVGLCGRTDAM